MWPSSASTRCGCVYQPSPKHSWRQYPPPTPVRRSCLPPLSLWLQGQLHHNAVTNTAQLVCVCRFYFEGNCSAGAKKLPPSPAPIDHTTCPTCGPYRRHGTAVAADVSSQSSSGYIRGVSPSPSELALPNTAFSTQQIHQASIETFEVCT